MGHHRVGPEKENIWKLPGVNRMGPVEGAEFFGISNICRVVMNGKPWPPFRNEMEKLKNIPNVIWSILGDSGSDRQGSCADDLSGFLELAAEDAVSCQLMIDYYRELGHDFTFEL